MQADRMSVKQESDGASWFRRWATYREAVPVRAQVVIVLVISLVMLGFAIWGWHEQGKMHDARQREMMERAGWAGAHTANVHEPR
jgi:hypothetical protein